MNVEPLLSTPRYGPCGEHTGGFDISCMFAFVLTVRWRGFGSLKWLEQPGGLVSSRVPTSPAGAAAAVPAVTVTAAAATSRGVSRRIEVPSRLGIDNANRKLVETSPVAIVHAEETAVHTQARVSWSAVARSYARAVSPATRSHPNRAHARSRPAAPYCSPSAR